MKGYLRTLQRSTFMLIYDHMVEIKKEERERKYFNVLYICYDMERKKWMFIVGSLKRYSYISFEGINK